MISILNGKKGTWVEEDGKELNNLKDLTLTLSIENVPELEVVIINFLDGTKKSFSGYEIAEINLTFRCYSIVMNKREITKNSEGLPILYPAFSKTRIFHFGDQLGLINKACYKIDFDDCKKRNHIHWGSLNLEFPAFYPGYLNDEMLIANKTGKI